MQGHLAVKILKYQRPCSHSHSPPSIQWNAVTASGSKTRLLCSHFILGIFFLFFFYYYLSRLAVRLPLSFSTCRCRDSGVAFGFARLGTQISCWKSLITSGEFLFVLFFFFNFLCKDTLNDFKWNKMYFFLQCHPSFQPDWPWQWKVCLGLASFSRTGRNLKATVWPPWKAILKFWQVLQNLLIFFCKFLSIWL